MAITRRWICSMISGPSARASSAESLGVGNLLRPHPSELPIHQVRAHLTLEHPITPVTHVLQEQQPQHHLGRRPRAPARAALRPAPCERLVNDLHQLTVSQQRIDLAHPLFPQEAYFLLDQTLGEGQLRATRGLDQLKPSCAAASAWHAPAASRARVSSTVARGCPRRSPPRSAETPATRPVHHERSRPVPPAHTPNALCLQPCSGNTDAGRGGLPDRVRTRRGVSALAGRLRK